MPGTRPLGVVLLAAVVCLLQGTGPVSAHATLVGETPADGSTVHTAPQRVVLRFDENIRAPSVVVVNGPTGARADHGPTAVLDNTATVPVTVVHPGVYTVAYRVVSADGHPVAAQTSFTFRSRGSAGSSAGASAGASTGSRTGPAKGPDTASGTGPERSAGGPSTSWLAAGVAVLLLGAAALLGVGRRRSPAASDNGDRR